MYTEINYETNIILLSNVLAYQVMQYGPSLASVNWQGGTAVLFMKFDIDKLCIVARILKSYDGVYSSKFI